jgi:anthranilate phosphoribosyltransferase
MNTPELLNTLIEKRNLSKEDAEAFLNSVVAGEMTPAQIAAVLIALRMKGETAEETAGLLAAMRSHMVKLQAPGAIDIVGTGGDGSGTFNISTASAFVAAGAGAKIAKHGNRAASSLCGSADVLEALGVNIRLTPEQAKAVFEKAGIVFMLAPLYHAALKEVVLVRKELKVRTIFNILGPFANPAGTKRQLIGVPNAGTAKMMSKVVPLFDYERVILVASEDGMDEISLSAKTHGYDITGKTVKVFTIDPKKFGFKAGTKKDIQGGTAEENAQIVRDILAGKKGPKRDIVVLNTAFALEAALIAKTPKDGIALAEQSIDSGAAKKALERLVQETNVFPPKADPPRADKKV